MLAAVLLVLVLALPPIVARDLRSRQVERVIATAVAIRRAQVAASTAVLARRRLALVALAGTALGGEPVGRDASTVGRATGSSARADAFSKTEKIDRVSISSTARTTPSTRAR